jgi:hypothetical protein
MLAEPNTGTHNKQKTFVLQTWLEEVNDILQNNALEESYVEESNSDFYSDTDEET